MNRVSAVVRASPVTDGAAPRDADAGLRLLGRVGIAARGVFTGCWLTSPSISLPPGALQLRRAARAPSKR